MLTTIATEIEAGAGEFNERVEFSLEDMRRPASREVGDRASQVVSPSTDVLLQLRSNLNQLEDLHGRLRHVMTEISSLLRR